MSSMSSLTMSRSRIVALGAARRVPALAPGLGQRLPLRSVHVKASQTVPLTIEIQQKVEFGETLKVAGNDPCFGDWNLDNALQLEWSDGDVWKGKTDIPVGVPLKFKLVIAGKGNGTWEGGQDREITALGPDFGLIAKLSWNATAETPIETVKIEGKGKSSSKKRSKGKGKAQVSMDESDAGLEIDLEGQDLEEAEMQDEQQQAQPRAKQAAASVAVAEEPFSGGNGQWSAESSGGGGEATFEEQGPRGAWVGADPEFVRSRSDRERRGQWNTEGLTGIPLELVKGDEKAPNWLKKLDMVHNLLVERHPMMRPGLEEMAACFIYTTWINTGAIVCAEGGSHFRPNHHANLALKMFRSLEWAIGDVSNMYGGRRDPQNDALIVMAARRMHARLPSISGEFRQSVPLTRIRDIAHRSDIPHDVKQEIKHTLQNKLHRCAGPEDLIASEKMLQKITARPGEFSEPFVNEFKIFMKELRDFFNATGLEDLLIKSQSALDEAHGSAVTNLLKTKKKVEGSGDKASLEELMTLLFSATQARTFYAAGLSAGLRNDVGDDVLEMRQRWRLCEIRLEDYCFVVLSRIVNLLEQQGGAGLLSKAPNNAWALPLSALTAGLRNLGLSQFKPKEMLALENELQAWHCAAPLVKSGKDNALRMKASMDRVMRVAADYADSIMKVYLQPAADLGKGLGMPPHMSSVFGESEVRSSVAFQVSKLAAIMSKALRIAAGQSAWDGLVTGEAFGILKEVPNLSPSVMEELARSSNASKDGMILVVKEAEGDEELGPLVPFGLRGVVLRQELPHLSHLGVRARQEKVVFATLDERDEFERIVRPLLGKACRLSVDPTEITLEEAKAGAAAEAAQKREAALKAAAATATSYYPRTPTDSWSGESEGEKAQLFTTLTILPLAAATERRCGAKAAKCAELEAMATSSRGLFKTPNGCCVPFGSMEMALLEASSAVQREFKELLASLDKPDLTGDALEAACNQIINLVSNLDLPALMLDEICGTFKPSALLAIRSSANVEDLAGMSAAGLYESVVGVEAYDRAAVQKAVTAVWASLYTRRAVLSRRIAKVPQKEATMCVLCQQLHLPKVSFVLHTARPSDWNTGILLVEAAPGQGETLAAATSGTPWRFEVNKKTGAVNTLAFANFSSALVLSPGRPQDGLVLAEVDYSKQRLTVDVEYRSAFGRRLAAVGSAIESFFDGVPQDIEGGLVPIEGTQDSELYIFQTRPQH